MIILLLLSPIVLGHSQNVVQHLKEPTVPITKSIHNSTGSKIKEECREMEVAVTEQVCHVEEETECGVCHTMYIKECSIRMKARNKPVRMRNCITVKGDTDCKDGYRRTCRTRYEAECGTQWQYRDVVEDRPVCGVDMVGKCDDTLSHDSRSADDKSTGRCVEIPVMRCRIEKQMVRKGMPRTSCRRMPKQFCRKTKCKAKKTKCFYKIQKISELSPVETCGYSPKKICQVTDETIKSCKTVKRQVCKPIRKIPNTVIKNICQQKYTVDTVENVQNKIATEGNVHNNLDAADKNVISTSRIEVKIPAVRLITD